MTITATVGGSSVPTTFGGHVCFHRQQTKPNGAGLPYKYGEQWYEWSVNGCSAADWDWWWTQYNRGSAMAFVLWSDDSGRGSISCTSGYLWEPKYGHVEGGTYLDVKIEIHALMPVQA